MNKLNNKLNHQPKSKRVKKEEDAEVIPRKFRHAHAKDETVPAWTKDAKIARQCEHIMINGEFCRALALRGRKYCYFHLVHIGRRLRAERVHEIAMTIGGDSSVLPTELPLLEDANSIQLALSHIIDDVLHNRLDNKRAGLVLYALQTASSNLANGVDFNHKEGATVAGSYDDFEGDYQLGETTPDLKVEESQEERVDESCVEQEDPHKPKEGLDGAPAGLSGASAPARKVVPHIPKDGVWGTQSDTQRGARCAESTAGNYPGIPFAAKKAAGICVRTSGGCEWWVVIQWPEDSPMRDTTGALQIFDETVTGGERVQPRITESMPHYADISS